MRATRAIGPALGASLVLLLAACGEDTPDTGVDPSSRFVAFVDTAETSLPRPGSDIENDPRTSPVAIFGRYFCFCSSVPCCISMWATMKWVLTVSYTHLTLPTTERV